MVGERGLIKISTPVLFYIFFRQGRLRRVIFLNESAWTGFAVVVSKTKNPNQSLCSDFVWDGNQVPVLPVSGLYDIFLFIIPAATDSGAVLHPRLLSGLGVSLTIHWFSEFVAGAIIGSVIGTVVGRSFKTKLAKK
jgi:hypothetical protein